jgi:molecular chaperone GrpE
MSNKEVLMPEETSGPVAEAAETPTPAADDGGPTQEELERSLEAELAVLSDRLAEQERVAAENHDKFMRALADLENYRRRARQESEEVRLYGNEKLISNLLGVLDNLERALQAAESTQNFEALRDGVSLTHKQLLESLGKSGLEPIEAVGKPFDPALHEAIMQVEASNGQAPNTVVEELRKGYTLNGRVLRASLVKVAA